jgi:hypothetical protein
VQCEETTKEMGFELANIEESNCMLQEFTLIYAVSVVNLSFFLTKKHFPFRDFGSVPVESVDMSQYWSLELEKCMKKIRLDFELLYAAIYREMTSYYETKMEEIQTEVEQAVHYQQIEIEELAVSIQTLQAEYEEVQKRLSYEQEIQIKLEATYCK